MQTSELVEITHHKITKGEAHHCYIIKSKDSDEITNFSNQLIEKCIKDKSSNLLEIKTDKANYQVDNFKEVYRFCEMASQSNRFINIYELDKLTDIIANKLLKVLEEAPKNITFFLMWNGEKKLLPTLASRSVIINLNAKENINQNLEGIKQDINNYLNGNLELHQLIENYKDRTKEVYLSILSLSSESEDFERLYNTCNAALKDKDYKAFNQSSMSRLCLLLGKVNS